MEAIVNAKNLRISTKKSIEVCNFIRNKNVEKAKTILNEVIQMKKPVPYKRFLADTPHRRGDIAAGRFPIKTCKEILSVVESGEANARNKGMETNLIISHISANKGPKQQHHGRQARTRMKNTHITLILKEISKGKKEIKKW